MAHDLPQAQLKFSHLWRFALCSSVLSTEAPAQETRGSCMLSGQQSYIAVSQRTRCFYGDVHLFHSKKKLSCHTVHVMMLRYAQSFPPVCPLPTSCHWSLLFLPGCRTVAPVLQASDIFNTITGDIFASIKALAPVNHLPFLPFFSMLFCAIYVSCTSRGEKNPTRWHRPIKEFLSHFQSFLD